MSGFESPLAPYALLKLHEVGRADWGRGWRVGWLLQRQRSLGSFGRVVRLCGLATVVPGLPGALEGLCPLLVHDHVVHALIWRRHARSITLQLRDKNLVLAFTDEKSPDSTSSNEVLPSAVGSTCRGPDPDLGTPPVCLPLASPSDYSHRLLSWVHRASCSTLKEAFIKGRRGTKAALHWKTADSYHSIALSQRLTCVSVRHFWNYTTKI